MKATYFVVDAFTNRPFAGNSAAVVPLPAWRNDSWLQAVAMEMNLAATAFFVAYESGYELRWFTPKQKLVSAGMPRSQRRSCLVGREN